MAIGWISSSVSGLLQLPVHSLWFTSASSLKNSQPVFHLVLASEDLRSCCPDKVICICLVQIQGSPLISEQRINLGGTFLLHAFHNDYSAMKCDPYYLGKDVNGIARNHLRCTLAAKANW